MSKRLYNPSPTRWLGTHCVSARIAAKLLRYCRMGEAYAALDSSDKCAVMTAIRPRHDHMADYQLDVLINPFNGKRDSRIIKCDFKLTDGTPILYRQWVNGKIHLFSFYGYYVDGRFYAKQS